MNQSLKVLKSSRLHHKHIKIAKLGQKNFHKFFRQKERLRQHWLCWVGCQLQGGYFQQGVEVEAGVHGGGLGGPAEVGNAELGDGTGAGDGMGPVEAGVEEVAVCVCERERECVCECEVISV